MSQNDSAKLVRTVGMGFVGTVAGILLGWAIGFCSGGAIFQPFAETFNLNSREEATKTLVVFTLVWAILGFIVGAAITIARSSEAVKASHSRQSKQTSEHREDQSEKGNGQE